MTTDKMNFVEKILANLPPSMVPIGDIYSVHSVALTEDGEHVLTIFDTRSGRAAGLLHRVGEEPDTPITYLD